MAETAEMRAGGEISARKLLQKMWGDLLLRGGVSKAKYHILCYGENQDVKQS